MNYFVDTSFWCALYDARDENHSRARQYWQNLAPLPVKLFTSDYIFDETEFSMGGVAPREAL